MRPTDTTARETLVELARAIRDGERSALEVAEEHLRAIDARDAHLRSFIAVDSGRVLAAARNADARRSRGTEPLPPLLGVPVAIKDNLATAGMPTTGGTSVFRDWRPARDADVVRSILDAGAIVLGKTNLHEAAFGIMSKNPHFGTVGNPVAPGHIAGGSSGGTAAAVVAGLAPGGIGTDTGGSVRVPAALCGCVGFRPVTSRVGRGGLMSLSWTCDAIGPITHTVADAQLLLAAMAGERAPASTIPSAESLHGLRVGVVEGAFPSCDRETAAAIGDFAAALEAAGATLSVLEVAHAAEAMSALFDIVLPESWFLLQQLVDEARPGASLAALLDEFGDDVRAALSSEGGPAADPVTAQRYLVALHETREAVRRGLAEAFTHVDVLLTPTTPTPAVRLHEEPDMTLNGERVPTFQTFISNCCVASLADLPALSLPAGRTDDGRPIGAQLMAPPEAESRLFAVGAAAEAVRAVAA